MKTLKRGKVRVSPNNWLYIIIFIFILSISIGSVLTAKKNDQDLMGNQVNINSRQAGMIMNHIINDLEMDMTKTYVKIEDISLEQNQLELGMDHFHTASMDLDLFDQEELNGIYADIDRRSMNNNVLELGNDTEFKEYVDLFDINTLYAEVAVRGVDNSVLELGFEQEDNLLIEAGGYTELYAKIDNLTLDNSGIELGESVASPAIIDYTEFGNVHASLAQMKIDNDELELGVSTRSSDNFNSYAIADPVFEKTEMDKLYSSVRSEWSNNQLELGYKPAVYSKAWPVIAQNQIRIEKNDFPKVQIIMGKKLVQKGIAVLVKWGNTEWIKHIEKNRPDHHLIKMIEESKALNVNDKKMKEIAEKYFEDLKKVCEKENIDLRIVEPCR